MFNRLTCHHLQGTTILDSLVKEKHLNLRTALIEGSGMDRIIACSKELITSAK